MKGKKEGELEGKKEEGRKGRRNGHVCTYKQLKKDADGRNGKKMA